MKQLADSPSTDGDITWCTKDQPIASGYVTSYAKQQIITCCVQIPIAFPDWTLNNFQKKIIIENIKVSCFDRKYQIMHVDINQNGN